MIGAKSAEHIGVVADRCGIDMPRRRRPVPPRVDPLGPIDEVAGEGEHLSGVAHGRTSTVTDSSTAAVTLEQGHADTSFEFGQALRQRRRAHPDPFCGEGPGGFVGHGNQVLHLTDAEVGKRTHLPNNTVDVLHNNDVP